MPQPEVLTIISPPLQTNGYLVEEPGGDGALAVDPGEGTVDQFLAALESRGRRLHTIFLTHGHIDHIGDARSLAERTGAELVGHAETNRLAQDAILNGSEMLGLPQRPFELDRSLSAGDRLELGGGVGFDLLETPGHCPGSLCAHGAGICVTGDLLFRDGVGRWDLPGGDAEILFESLRRLCACLDDETRIYPGHGPASTLGRERKHNPYLAEI